jgi:HAD superfamily hydrolase (TIGR01509 family)
VASIPPTNLMTRLNRRQSADAYREAVPPVPPDLVIFDCDGVLIDTERIAVPIDVEVLAGLGWAITEEEVVERFLGRSEADCNQEIEAHLGHPLPSTLSFELDRRYREAFEQALAPVEGVVALLDTLDRHAVPTCVASSGGHEKMQFTLGLTGLYERFEGRIYSAEEVDEGKPAPDLFLFAASSLQVAPERCAVVEDSPYGVEAALAAGMAAYAFAGGLTPLRRLQIPNATVFHRMDQLPALFGL